ncbi:uncharacterized protein LOC143292122 [Babylonia areolata]|uniref:uncharacterized protein LOC143292122 n=1 Tax=Babylonia areolata TaxID=304850 RepID=UPI003FD20170
MAKMKAILCSLVIFCCLCCIVGGYPLGDLTLEGLLGGSEVMTVSRRRRAVDSSASNGCKYPGTVAVTVGSRVLFTGLYQRGTVRLPSDTLEILKLSNKFNVLTVYGDDGSATATIARDAIEGATVKNKDGTSTVKLSTDFSSTSCPTKDAILFDSATMAVDVSTCKIVSYGGSQTSLHTYNGELQTDPLAPNNMKGCCAHVMANILGRGPNLGHPAADVVANSFTCLRSQDGICNGDIGAPVYCLDGRSGRQVVVGMVDSGTCTAAEYFGAIDFTQGTLAGFSSSS